MPSQPEQPAPPAASESSDPSERPAARTTAAAGPAPAAGTAEVPAGGVQAAEGPADTVQSAQGPAADVPAADVASEAETVPPAEERPRSHYELPSRRNTSVRNMVWALVVIMVGVAAGAVAFFGVGTDLGREVPETSQLDVAESAERARTATDLPVAEPRLGEGWTAREARLSASGAASWELQYTSPSGALITLQEQAEVSAPMLSAALPGTVVEGETSIDGAACQVLSSETEGQVRRGMSCQGEDWGILVHGEAEDAELRTLMESAIASLG